MIELAEAPKLILPPRPAIIRPGIDLATYFPVEIDRKTRRAIVAELAKRGVLDDRKAIEAAIPFGMFAPAAAPFDISYITASNNSADQTSYTYSALSLGAVHPLRYILVASVGQHASSNVAATSLTVAGVSATKIFERTPATSAIAWSCWLVALPTGTTGNVVITYPSAQAVNSVAVFRVINPPRLTPFATSTAATATSKTVNVPAGGYIIGMATNSATTAFTFTGITEVYDSTSGTARVGYGLQNFASAVTGQVVSINAGGLGLMSI